MSDPKRWLDDGAALDPDTRRALEAGRDIEPDRVAHASVWGALLAQLPPVGPAGAGGGVGGGMGGGAGAAASGGAGAAAGGSAGAAAGGAGAAMGGAGGGALGAMGVLKALGVGAGAGLAVLIGGQTMIGSSTPVPPSAPMASASVAASAVPVVAPVIATAEPVIPAPPEPSRAVEESPSEVPRGGAGADVGRVGAVREEARWIAQARQCLLRDDVDGALALLERARQRYPDGVLVQEREALAIEALAKSGRPEAAARRAREFQAAHPDSPLQQRVRDSTR